MQRCKISIDITKALTCGTFREKVICEHQSRNCGIMFQKIVTLKILHISVINKTSLLHVIEFCRPYEALAVMCSRIASWTCDASFLRFLLRIRFFYEKERKMLIFTVTRHFFFPYYSQTSLQRPHWAQRKVGRWGELGQLLCEGRHLLLVGKKVRGKLLWHKKS